MSKLLMSVIVTTLALNAGLNNKELTKYFKKHIVKNPSVELNGVEVVEIKKIAQHPGWEAYLTNMKLKFNGQEITVPQIIFVNGSLATPVLIDTQRNRDYSKEFKPKVPVSIYNDEHLLFGNKDAKHKIVVFSDPQCPYCIEIVPDIMSAAQEHPETFALYYYHLPLMRIHPVSGIIVRVMHVAQKKGKNDIVKKLYSLKIDPRETDVDKVLAAIKKHSGFVVTKEEIEAEEIIDALKADEDSGARMMVSGTPTIFVDGKWDKMREKYKTFIPQK